jgi:kynurenine formamidase
MRIGHGRSDGTFWRYCGDPKGAGQVFNFLVEVGIRAGVTMVQRPPTAGHLEDRRLDGGAPMRIIDLSAVIVPSRPDALSFERVELAFTSHAEGAGQIQSLLGVPPALLRDAEGWAIEEFTRLGTHSVTHVDAPWHYNSQIQGQRAATIDELPLEWFFSDGVALDMAHKADGERVEAADVEAALASIGCTLKPLDIVLVRTGRDAHYGQPDYVLRGPAVSPEATRWLYERGVRVMGIDAWGWDGPLDRQAREALARQEPGVFWAAHQCDLSYSQVERLVNLGSLPPTGFKVACFPLKIQGGSAGPARVVAILSD